MCLQLRHYANPEKMALAVEGMPAQGNHGEWDATLYDRLNVRLSQKASVMHGLPLLQIVAVAILILANGFFVAAEFALVSMRDTRIEQLIAARIPGAAAVQIGRAHV